MKRLILISATLSLLLMFQNGLSQTDTILIDFGSSSILSDLPWNNQTDQTLNGISKPLFNSSVRATPYELIITDRFNGINTGGTSSPDPLLKIPSSGSGDSFFGNLAPFSGLTEPTGGMQFSGLDPAKTYKIIIFGSRSASDNRETKYVLTGATTEADSINVSNNTANILEFNLAPKADGSIDLLVSPGGNNNNSYGFYYLNAVKIIYAAEDFPQPSLSITSPNGGESFTQGSVQTITWTSANLYRDVVVAYSDDNGSNWINIDTLDKTENSFDWTIPDYPTNMYKVKVSSWLTEDESDAVFEVQGSLPDNDTIMIDFSFNNDNLSDDPWNNFTSSDLGSGINYLKNSNNLMTYASAEITDRFTGTNQNGTLTPGGALKIPASASRDSYYGSTVEWQGVIESTGGLHFSGLDKDKDYIFEMFASRMGVGDNRETKYVFTGIDKDSVYLDPANNENLSVNLVVRPADDGTVDIRVSPGENNTNSYHFYYLGAMKIIYEKEDPVPPTIVLESPNGGEDWFSGTDHEINWAGINLTEEIFISYSIDNGTNWMDIDTVDHFETKTSWTIPDSPSTECLVRIKSGLIEDISESTFTISEASNPAIVLEMPNGGEEFIAGSVQFINWTPNLLTEDITLSFSSDNGSSWSEIGTTGPAETGFYWTVPDLVSTECLIKLSSGDYSDVSAATFSITAAICSNTIVVLGSSTSAGTGASPIDSAWVWRYEAALKAMNTDYEIVNLGVGGYSTFQIVPDNTEFDEGISETIDEARNVTKAITHNPFAIIVNMPSNDAARGYSADQTMANLKLVFDYGNANAAKVWIATTQPRNFSEQSLIDIQEFLAEEIQDVYGEYSLDFWSGIAGADGKILSDYNSGDGVHLNNAGHRILFEEVLAAGIHTQACLWTGVSETEVDHYLSVYPNPASDEFTIRYYAESSGQVSFRFYDITGRLLAERFVRQDNAGTYEESFGIEEFGKNYSMIIGVIQTENAGKLKQSALKILLSK